MRPDDVGNCEHCRATFHYSLIHNGFGDTAYAYCASCGKLCLLSGWYKGMPKNSGLKLHRCIAPEIEPLLESCSCGGHFKAGASPRCPSCRQELSAEKATVYLEKNAPGTTKGWRWQRNWIDAYALMIERQVAEDNWKPQ